MEKKKIQAIKDFIISAEKSIRNAKKILTDVLGEESIDLDASIDLDTNGLHSYKSGQDKIVEGVFTGEEMLGADGNKYPVPVNYASKSKLVQWDRLKLTVDPTGRMMYKQIMPIERDMKVALLAKDNAKFIAVADGVTYNVLTAAVTHFKAEIGDSITIIVPKGKEATFAAIEAVIPKS
jgi:hypothetical protein